jgi:hypothetical protein
MDSFCFWTNNEIIVDEMGKSGYIIHSNVLILMGIILIHNIFRDRVFENPHSYAASAVLNFSGGFFIRLGGGFRRRWNLSNFDKSFEGL